MAANLIYGCNEKGRIVHIKDVPSGLKCECVCPECSTLLVAKKGEIISKHFAHKNGKDCPGAMETALHKLAKQIVLEADGIVLPDGTPFTYSKAEEEKQIDKIRVDLMVSNGNREIIVEIYVTHAVDNDKAALIQQLKCDAFEIDLSKVTRDASPDDVKSIVLDRPQNRKWIIPKNVAPKNPGSKHHSQDERKGGIRWEGILGIGLIFLILRWIFKKR